jgi:hypothetical protein
LHWALILKYIQQAVINVQARKILKPRFKALLDFKPLRKQKYKKLIPTQSYSTAGTSHSNV